MTDSATPRSAVVTGGNRGIGLACARALRGLGHRVTITTRGGPAPDDLTAVRCDITDEHQVREAFTAVERDQGPVEVLVANAGVTDDASFLEMSLAQFTGVVDTNLTGTYLTVRHGVRGMLRRRWGRIVLISSISGVWGVAGQANYNASKAALVGLSRSLAREFGPHGITVNVVMPGYVETDMTAGLPSDRRDLLVRETAVRRPGTPEEVADAVAWLAGDGSAYVTGAVIPITGGLAMGI